MSVILTGPIERHISEDGVPALAGFLRVLRGRILQGLHNRRGLFGHVFGSQRVEECLLVSEEGGNLLLHLQGREPLGQDAHRHAADGGLAPETSMAIPSVE